MLETSWLAWSQLVQPFASDPTAVRFVFDELVRNYSGDSRYYHNLDHIRQVLADVDALQDAADNFTVIRLAAWFHDVIYDPHSAENELNSAIYARERLVLLGASPPLIDLVNTLILDTRHMLPPDSIDGMILVDADLVTLGASLEVYQDTARRVRLEFSHVPQQQYALGRVAQLRNFLARQRLYYLDEVAATYEAPARANIAWEIGKWERQLVSSATVS
jgi:predicted metal-dependent HD superfamily phosphohydrolase